MKDITKVIGERIDERGMTMTTVARRAGMTPDLLSRTINGTRKLKADELVNLCRVLDLTLEDFEQKEAYA